MRIGFVGAGAMAEAIVASLLRADYCKMDDVIISDVNCDRLNLLSEKLGVRTVNSNREVVESCDVVILAVKPQNLDDVLVEIDSISNGKLMVSIAAGKRIAYFESKLPGARVVRVMPNLACRVGEGMSAYCGGSTTAPDDLALVGTMLKCSGKAIELEEELFDVVTAVSGSGPAFFAYVLNFVVDGALKQGLPEESALLLAKQTMLGTAKVLVESGDSPANFIAQVASKGGTTAAGLAVLDDSDLADVLRSTVAAAAERSRELSS